MKFSTKSHIYVTKTQTCTVFEGYTSLSDGSRSRSGMEGAKKHRPDGVVRKRLGDPVKLNKHVPVGC